MSIKPTGSMTAANCTACSWVTNAAKSAGNTLVAGATKVANFVASSFQVLAHYASLAVRDVRNLAVTGLNALKAHPQVAVGSLAVVALAAAAVYAYNHRATA